MRSLKTLLPAILVTCMLAGSAQASISGSKHDFGQFGWAQNQICLPCHTPHNSIVKDANGVVVGGPLWNHTLSTAQYDLYIDDAGVKTKGNVDTNSILCLSCHDGTVAVDSFGGATGSTQMTGAVLGTDLTNDHPIGEAAKWPVPNPSYMVDPSLRDAKRIQPLRKLATGELAVGCTSCHEPHDRAAQGPQGHLLWVNNSGPYTTVDNRTVSGSGLCMNCHKK